MKHLQRRLKLPTPRLLPATILVMAALLTVKTTSLVRVASAGAASEPPAASAQGPQVSQTEAAKIEAARAEAARVEAARNASTKPGAAPAAEPAQPTPPPSTAPLATDSERALLTDLRARHAALDAREATLAAREAAMAAVEQRLTGRVDELTALQHRLEALETQRKQRDEQNWRGLVKLYETMKPRDAALIFNDLDLPVLLPVLDRMKEAKAAPILAAMTPDRARLVTSELAQTRARSNSIEPVPGAAPRPGG